MKILFFQNYVDINNMQLSSIVSSNEKYYKYFIGYTSDDCRITRLFIMLIIMASLKYTALHAA